MECPKQEDKEHHPEEREEDIRRGCTEGTCSQDSGHRELQDRKTKCVQRIRNSTGAGDFLGCGECIGDVHREVIAQANAHNEADHRDDIKTDIPKCHETHDAHANRHVAKHYQQPHQLRRDKKQSNH